MPQEYTPSGSAQAYTVPAYSDVVDGEVFTRALMDDVAAGIAAAIAAIPAPDMAVAVATASATAALVNANGLIAINSTSATTLTIPANATVPFNVGASISGLRQGTGTMAFAAASGVTLLATPGLNFRAVNSFATAIKIATNTWVVTGDLVA